MGRMQGTVSGEAVGEGGLGLRQAQPDQPANPYREAEAVAATSTPVPPPHVERPEPAHAAPYTGKMAAVMRLVAQKNKEAALTKALEWRPDLRELPPIQNR